LQIKALSRIIWLFIIIGILYLIFYNIPQFFKIIYPLRYQNTITKYAEEYTIDAPLIAAVIKTESNFYTFAESRKGARGLMQVTPATGKWIAEKLKIDNYNDNMLYDPEINIKFGCWYIQHLCKYFNNDYKLVLAAYNGGMGNVDKWLKDNRLSYNGTTLDIIPFKETSEFVERVKKNYKVYKKLYEWTK
jgi:soluble lytic murein transglycosylase